MIFDCHFRHAIVINRLSIQINRHLSTPINCPTSSGHSIISSIDCTTSSDHSIFPSIDCPRHPAIRLFPQSIAQRRPAIRLFPQSIAQRRPTIRLFPQSIAQRRPTIRFFPQSIVQRRPTIRLFPQSIAQGLHPGLGCVASSTLERMNFIPPRCIFQRPLFSSSSNPHTILWISNNLHADDNISS